MRALRCRSSSWREAFSLPFAVGEDELNLASVAAVDAEAFCAWDAIEE